MKIALQSKLLYAYIQYNIYLNRDISSSNNCLRWYFSLTFCCNSRTGSNRKTNKKKKRKKGNFSHFLLYSKQTKSFWLWFHLNCTSLSRLMNLTSALYMRIRPWLTLAQVGTALIFQSWLECSAKGPVFI